MTNKTLFLHKTKISILKTIIKSVTFSITHSVIDGPFGWKPCNAFAAFARAKSVITVLLVGFVMLLIVLHNSGRFRPIEPAVWEEILEI
jgi:hypothetical protein